MSNNQILEQVAFLKVNVLDHLDDEGFLAPHKFYELCVAKDNGLVGQLNFNYLNETVLGTKATSASWIKALNYCGLSTEFRISKKPFKVCSKERFLTAYEHLKHTNYRSYIPFIYKKYGDVINITLMAEYLSVMQFEEIPDFRITGTSEVLQYNT